jgi:hypothetical protein
MANETKDMCCDVFFEERIDKKGSKVEGESITGIQNRGERQQITSQRVRRDHS